MNYQHSTNMQRRTKERKSSWEKQKKCKHKKEEGIMQIFVSAFANRRNYSEKKSCKFLNSPLIYLLDAFFFNYLHSISFCTNLSASLSIHSYIIYLLLVLILVILQKNKKLYFFKIFFCRLLSWKQHGKRRLFIYFFCHVSAHYVTWVLSLKSITVFYKQTYDLFRNHWLKLSYLESVIRLCSLKCFLNLCRIWNITSIWSM